MTSVDVVQGGTGIGLVLAALLCPVLTLIILARFRAAVGRSMKTRVGAAVTPPPAVSRSNAPGSARLQVYPAGLPPTRGPLAVRAHARVRQTVAWYVAAGLFAALVAALVQNLLLADWLGLWPIAVSVFEHVWPLILSVAFVAGLSRRQTLLLLGGYALGGLLLTGGSATGALAVVDRLGDQRPRAHIDHPHGGRPPPAGRRPLPGAVGGSRGSRVGRGRRSGRPAG